MKIDAKEILKILAQELGEDFTEEELQQAIEQGVGLEPSAQGNLERAFASKGNPDRLRVIDPEGNMSDVFISSMFSDGTFQIGVQPLELKVVYPPNFDRFNSWGEAEQALTQGWEVYDAIGGQQVQASDGSKFLLFSSKDGKVYMLKVSDDGPNQ